jgi:hypothetical protein
MYKSTNWRVVAAAAICLAPNVLMADTKECSLDTLDGSYIFSATGFTLVAAVWVPKAIVEYIHFNADGTLTVSAATVANPFGNTGQIIQSPPGTGTYTLGADCKGTLQFTGGPSFDIFVAPKGEDLWMIQTNPNNVFQGKVERVR